jgi:transcriptional regulator with PAS, ATPase and Fis domain
MAQINPVRVEAPVFLGDSEPMRRVRDDIRAAARSDAKVLIVGETGVGKEIVARLIHDNGARRFRTFVTINCAGVPDSLLESELFGHVRGSFTGAYRDKPGLVALADHGTLFLDELGEMSLRMQALLLRFVETGEIQRVGSDRIDGRVNVRIVTATNRNLADRIATQDFRGDLYYRLNVIRLVIPPLRERQGDILLLLGHFLAEYATAQRMQTPKLTQAAEDILTTYQWPGNVRELKNVVERIMVRQTTDLIHPENLPAEVVDAVALAARPSVPEPSAIPTSDPRSRIEACWDQMVVRGGSFWTVVYPTFLDRELTKSDLRQLIKCGLQRTQGSYKKLIDLFHMAPGDYKRFLAFLYQHDCHLPFQGFREERSEDETPRQARG